MKLTQNHPPAENRCRERQDAAPMRIDEELPRGPDAAARIRLLLSGSLGHALGRGLGSEKLIASELVNDAVVHGEGRIWLVAGLGAGWLQINVLDEGKRFEQVLREVPLERVSGRGLAIVDAISSRSFPAYRS